MELGFDAKRLFCNFTGLGNYSRTLVKNIKTYHPEYNLHLYTPEIRINKHTEPFHDKQAYNVHLSKGYCRKLWRTYGIVKDLRRDGIKLYHGLSHEIPLQLHKTGIRSVVSIHDLIFKIYPETYSPIDRKIYDLKFGYACRRADRIIAISQSTRQDIIRHYGVDETKIDVIYQGCTTLFEKDHLLSEEEALNVRKKYNLPKDYVLYVGSVERRKNLKTLLLALAAMKKESRPFLIIVGKGGRYKNECKIMAARQGLNTSVLWLDFLWENSHLQFLYQNARAFIYPSLYEGFGLPVAEALFNKAPVITSNTSSLPEAGGPTTLYVDPMSPDEIAAAILKVLGDKELQTEMAKRGFEYANQMFDSKKTTQQVIETYCKTLK